jgi:DNA-binding transcriptional regulator YdaS (Cro superfamily)
MEKLTTWRKALPNPTLEAAGKLLGVSTVQMMRLEKGERRVPAERLAEFEAVTGIPREELRPDIFAPAAFPVARAVTPSDMDAARYEEAILSASPEALP